MSRVSSGDDPADTQASPHGYSACLFGRLLLDASLDPRGSTQPLSLHSRIFSLTIQSRRNGLRDSRPQPLIRRDATDILKLKNGYPVR